MIKPENKPNETFSVQNRKAPAFGDLRSYRGDIGKVRKTLDHPDGLASRDQTMVAEIRADHDPKGGNCVSLFF